MSILNSDSSVEDYLVEYYSHVGQENAELLNHYAKNYHLLKQDTNHLEIGGGPTIYQLVSLSNRITKITFTDYSTASLKKVDDWLKNKSFAKNWDEFIEYSINAENCNQSIDDRKKQIRLLKIYLKQLDIFNPRYNKIKDKFDSVSLNFIAESVAENEAQWIEIINNSSNFLKPDGLLFMSAIRNAQTWRNGEDTYKCYSLSEEVLVSGMKKLGFSLITSTSVDAEKNDSKVSHSQGYDGLMFFVFRKV